VRGGGSGAVGKQWALPHWGVSESGRVCAWFFFRTAVRRVGLKMIRVELDHCGVSELLKIPI
jgi:hypothetical protein